MSILQKIKLSRLSTDQFVDESTPKNQLYIHHTAGSSNPYGVQRWWESTRARIGTALVIGGAGGGARWVDGEIVQLFNSSKWAWHLGLKQSHLAKGGASAKSNKILNSQSIGIEICNWGQLTETDKGFQNYVGGIVPDDEVSDLCTPYKGFRYYQKYTDAQLENTFELLKFLGKKWDIPTAFKGVRMFDVCPEALQGESGIWTHTSVRPDKFDCFPQPELITMLKSF